MARDVLSVEASEEAEGRRSLCLFSASRFPPGPAAVRSLLSDVSCDGDVAVARAERALHARFPGHRHGRGCWARPAEPLPRGLRVYLEDAEDAADEVVVAVERIARECGLGVLDEGLEEVMFPTALDREQDLLDACASLIASGDGYLLCEGGPDDAYFVQAFAARSDGSVIVEAVGNSVLRPPHRLPRRRLAELRRRGWSRPSKREPSHSRQLALGAAGTPQRLADLMRETLVEIYGLDARARVVLCLALG